MKTRTSSKIAAAATFTVLLLSGNATTGSAQGTKPMGDTTHKHQPAMAPKTGMPGMQEMAGMPHGPHHMLAMAYRDNLVTFAHALHSDVTRSKTVNLELARPAVAEMRRSFDQMRQHHQAQMSTMTSEMKSSMAGMMQDMEKHVTALGEHLTALETEIQASAPAPAKVSEHTAEILKLCEGMMKMPAKAKAHPM